MVSFTSRPLYSQGKSPSYPLDRRLGGPQARKQFKKKAFKALAVGVVKYLKY
jgi:hypothetical protein